jgi:hypothetical protein
MISGVQRSARISAALAIGQYSPYPRPTLRVSRPARREQVQILLFPGCGTWQMLQACDGSAHPPASPVTSSTPATSATTTPGGCGTGPSTGEPAGVLDGGKFVLVDGGGGETAEEVDEPGLEGGDGVLDRAGAGAHLQRRAGEKAPAGEGAALQRPACSPG